MPSVKVTYQGLFAELAGKRAETVEVEKATLSGLFSLLAACYGVRFREALADPESRGISGTGLVIVNGERLPPEAELSDGDEVAFLVPYQGGS